MTAYDCQPSTLWMLITLIPMIALFCVFMKGVSLWSAWKYPRLIDDMNRRRIFDNGMVMVGIVIFGMGWAYTFELLCRV